VWGLERRFRRRDRARRVREDPPSTRTTSSRKCGPPFPINPCFHDPLAPKVDEGNEP